MLQVAVLSACAVLVTIGEQRHVIDVRDIASYSDTFIPGVVNRDEKQKVYKHLFFLRFKTGARPVEYHSPVSDRDNNTEVHDAVAAIDKAQAVCAAASTGGK